eukprot:COSAG02_NODE_49432_length_327_cov_0.451754_1_plen_59_part_10
MISGLRRNSNARPNPDSKLSPHFPLGFRDAAGRRGCRSFGPKGTSNVGVPERLDQVCTS